MAVAKDGDEGKKRKGIWIPADLHRRLKMRAAEREISVYELVEEYLRWGIEEMLVADRPKRPKKRPRKE